MYLATKTVTGMFPVIGKSDDKAVIAEKMTAEVRRVKANILKGEHYKGDELLPCIVKSMVERGVFVESEPVNTETNANISGGKALEGNTQVSVGAPE